jgi:hypothetical protein
MTAKRALPSMDTVKSLSGRKLEGRPGRGPKRRKLVTMTFAGTRIRVPARDAQKARAAFARFKKAHQAALKALVAMVSQKRL